MPGCLLDRGRGAGGQIDAEFAQGATQTVDPGSSGGLPLVAQAMQLQDGLLRLAFDRYRLNIFAAPCFEQSAGVTAIVLVAPSVKADMLCREQSDVVTVSNEDARPVVRGAACFAQDPAYRQLRDEFSELDTVEPVSRDHLPGIVRQRHLETIFCQIDAEGSTPLIRMPSICPLGFRHFQLGTSMPKKQEESIS